jgi:hypothetical protein
MAKKMKVPIPAWLMNLPVPARYVPQYLESRYDGKNVLVVTANTYGQATIKFLDGPRIHETRGVGLEELQPVPPAAK